MKSSMLSVNVDRKPQKYIIVHILCSFSKLASDCFWNILFSEQSRFCQCYFLNAQILENPLIALLIPYS